MSRYPCPGCGLDAWSQVEIDQHRGLGHFALAERRQRAREAAFDAPNGPASGDIEPAIETATRVQVDAKVLAAALDAYDRDMIDSETNVYDTICAAFRAAGFEVER